MSVTEAERAALRTALTEEIGEDPADILMRSTLPQGPDRLATKDDLNALATQVAGGFANLHAKVDGGFANLHAKVDGGFAKVDGEFAKVYGEFAKMYGGFANVYGGFAELHAKVDGGFAKVEGEFAKMQGAISESRADVAEQVAKESRRTMIAMAAAVMTIWVTLLVAFGTLISVWPDTPAQPPPPPAAAHAAAPVP